MWRTSLYLALSRGEERLFIPSGIHGLTYSVLYMIISCFSYTLHYTNAQIGLLWVGGMYSLSILTVNWLMAWNLFTVDTWKWQFKIFYSNINCKIVEQVLIFGKFVMFLHLNFYVPLLLSCRAIPGPCFILVSCGGLVLATLSLTLIRSVAILISYFVSWSFSCLKSFKI